MRTLIKHVLVLIGFAVFLQAPVCPVCVAGSHSNEAEKSRSETPGETCPCVALETCDSSPTAALTGGDVTPSPENDSSFTGFDPAVVSPDLTPIRDTLIPSFHRKAGARSSILYLWHRSFLL